jgi:AcrR family transcriptional regulator
LLFDLVAGIAIRPTVGLQVKPIDERTEMADLDEATLPAPTKTRVIKAPAIRRAELIDCAQALFLSKGYERTTINDVIEAAGLSKGAFYHHFTAKEDLLEAVAMRFGQQALAGLAQTDADASLDALQRLNRVLAMGREWKIEHLPQLVATFSVLLRPENGVLYHRIVGAMFTALAPAVTAIIEQGEREGLFDVADARTAAEVLLGLAEGRRPLVLKAQELVADGDVDGALDLIMHRVRVEESIVDRVLGLPPHSVAFVGSAEEMKLMLEAWRATLAS